MSKSRADEITWKLIQAILRELDEDRSREVHITDLVYECPRRAWYEKTLGYGVTSIDSALTLWIGKKLHETGMDGCEHEVPVRLNIDGVEVVGSIDELCDDGELIIDKKTTARMPSKPYDHHILQVLLYSAALVQMGRKMPKRGAIVYIDVASKSVRAYEFNISAMSLESALNEVRGRARALYNAMRSGRPPERKPGWICNYCPYIRRCAYDG